MKRKKQVRQFRLFCVVNADGEPEVAWPNRDDAEFYRCKDVGDRIVVIHHVVGSLAHFAPKRRKAVRK